MEGARNIGFLKSVWRYLTKVKSAEKRAIRELVGIDKSGNKYYILSADRSVTGKEARLIEPSKEIEDQHDHLTNYGMDMKIPVEWNSWLRGMRKFPPTPQEIERNEINKIKMAEKVRRLQMKDEAERLGLKPGDIAAVDNVNKDIGAISKDLTTETTTDKPHKVPFPKYGDAYEIAPGYSKSARGKD